MAAKYVSFGMRSPSLALALIAFAGCAPAQTTRTIYVHEVVVVEAPRASAKARPHQNNRHGWAPGRAHAPASPHVTRNVSVVTVEQQVLIETAPRQTDNPIPRQSAFFATPGDRSSKGENEKGRSVDDGGRSKEGHADGASRRTKAGSEHGAKEHDARERDAKRNDPKKKRDARRRAAPHKSQAEAKRDAQRRAAVRDAQRKAAVRKAAEHNAKVHKARERDAKRTNPKKKRDAQRATAPGKSPAEAKRDAKKRDAKKKEQDRKREARAEAKTRPNKAKATPKERRAAQKRKPSLEALARR